jgi:hypothetical protein
MRKICLLILLLLIFISSAKSQGLFIKEYHNYKIDTAIDVAILYKSNFYCLKSNHEILVINSKTNRIDSTYKDNSRDIKILNLYLHHDTLVGLNRSNTYYLNTLTNQWTFIRKGSFIPPTYEDDNFIITSTCSGEWGGSLYFRDKRTSKLYECQSTCTVNIIKTDNKYSITASLSHLSGSVNIFEIEDPLKLKVYNRDYLQKKRDAAKKKHQLYVGIIGDDESNSKQGTIQLIDSIGIISPISFKYGSQIYYIVEKYKNVTIDIIQDKKLVPVDDLTSLNIWSDYPESRTCNDRQIFSFKNDKSTGFVFIDKNKLTFYSFDLKPN